MAEKDGFLLRRSILCTRFLEQGQLANIVPVMQAGVIEMMKLSNNHWQGLWMWNNTLKYEMYKETNKKFDKYLKQEIVKHMKHLKN
jgi:hypothetical protein